MADIFQRHVDTDPMVLMLGANAEPGEKDGEIVMSDGFSTSLNTPHFRNLLATWELFLPGTSDIHWGPRSTWTSIDGQTEHYIDYITISKSWNLDV